MALEAKVRHARREGMLRWRISFCPLPSRSLIFLLDAPIILEFIKALASYEKEPDSVEATVETIEQTIAFAPSDSAANGVTEPDTEPINPKRPCRCLLLCNQLGNTVAMALYFYNYSTWRARPGIYLDDIFIQPSERGKGYGKRLMVELAKQVISMKGGRLEWAVLKWNEPSIKFYQSLGANEMDEWVGMRVEGHGLERLAHILD